MLQQHSSKTTSANHSRTNSKQIYKTFTPSTEIRKIHKNLKNNISANNYSLGLAPHHQSYYTSSNTNYSAYAGNNGNLTRSNQNATGSRRSRKLGRHQSQVLFESLYVDGLLRKKHKIEVMQAHQRLRAESELDGCTFEPNIDRLNQQRQENGSAIDFCQDGAAVSIGGGVQSSRGDRQSVDSRQTARSFDLFYADQVQHSEMRERRMQSLREKQEETVQNEIRLGVLREKEKSKIMLKMGYQSKKRSGS